jgi:hypothetical protein
MDRIDAGEWEFLRGIYAVNPLTPPGLPHGDKAALAKVDGSADGLIFFNDGDLHPDAGPRYRALDDGRRGDSEDQS